MPGFVLSQEGVHLIRSSGVSLEQPPKSCSSATNSGSRSTARATPGCASSWAHASARTSRAWVAVGRGLGSADAEHVRDLPLSALAVVLDEAGLVAAIGVEVQRRPADGEARFGPAFDVHG